MAGNPFAVETDKPLVALCGARNGYIMLAPDQVIETYTGCPDELFLAAKAWASRLELSGSPRVYWVTLSEEVRHLHIHLFPRWDGDVLKGIPLFESRNTEPQPDWEPEVKDALRHWAEMFEVEIIDPHE